MIFIMIIIIDIIILITNIHLLFIFKSDFIYRNVDYFFVSFNAQSFYNISDYLGRKYQKVINHYDSAKTNIKNISLYFIQFKKDRPIHKKLINDMIKIIKHKYAVLINSKNPDYLIYNVFGCKYLLSKYNNSIKIAYFTENQLPDFSKADYCIGNSHINYLDRYFRMPVYFINRINTINHFMFNFILYLLN